MCLPHFSVFPQGASQICSVSAGQHFCPHWCLLQDLYILQIFSQRGGSKLPSGARGASEHVNGILHLPHRHSNSNCTVHGGHTPSWQGSGHACPHCCTRLQGLKQVGIESVQSRLCLPPRSSETNVPPQGQVRINEGSSGHSVELK